MRNRPLIALLLAALLMLPCASYGQFKGTITLPNSVLLFGETGETVPGTPYEELLVVSATSTVVVRPPAGFWGINYDAVPPALAPAADRVAWGLGLHDDTRREKLKSVLGVYSLLDKSWKTYGDFCVNGIGWVVFSPDGRKVAFASKAGLTSADSYCFGNPIVLQILDLATGRFTPIPYPGGVFQSARLTWSPDGKYLAGQIGAWSSPTNQIVVIDVGSGSGKVITGGTNPSWSPKGDWIAYEDKNNQKCMLIHPDGSGAKVLRKGPGRGFFGHWIIPYGAEWSPDGAKLLFNETEVDGSRSQVTVLDLSSGKLTELSRNSRLVLGWAKQSAN